MFPKGTVTAAVTPAEKPPVTAQKESTVVYMVDNTDSQVDGVNHPYWRTQRTQICACAVVLTTLILVAGALVGIAIVLTHTGGVETIDPHPSLNNDREPLLSNEVPLPKLPESTIRIKIDDGGLLPPTEPTTPDLIAIDDVTDDIATELLPTISLSSSGEEPQSSSVPSYPRGRNYISSSYPYDGWYSNGQEGTPPWDRSDLIGPSEGSIGDTDEDVSGDETVLEVSGDDQENDESDANGQVEGTPPWDRSDWTGPSIGDTDVEVLGDETVLEVSGDDQENDFGSGEAGLTQTEDEPSDPYPDLDTFYDGRFHSLVWFDSYQSFIISQRD